MKNIYHSDIYKFNTPVKSYWEDNSQENLNLEKLTKDVNKPTNNTASLIQKASNE